MQILHGEGMLAKLVVENRYPVTNCDEIVTLIPAVYVCFSFRKTPTALRISTLSIPVIPFS